MQETQVWFLGREDSLEKKMATHSSILACRIPWIEEPDKLQSMGLQQSDTTIKPPPPPPGRRQDRHEHSRVWLCDCMDYRPPGYSVHGDFPGKVLEWVAISSSSVSSWPGIKLTSPALKAVFFFFFFFYYFSHWGSPLLTHFQIFSNDYAFIFFFWVNC